MAGRVSLPEGMRRAINTSSCAGARVKGMDPVRDLELRPTGRESRHNQNYWVRGEYLGLGPSAHSHRKGRRWPTPPR